MSGSELMDAIKQKSEYVVEDLDWGLKRDLARAKRTIKQKQELMESAGVAAGHKLYPAYLRLCEIQSSIYDWELETGLHKRK